MKIAPTFLGLILFAFLALPVLAATGEGNVTVLDKDGKAVDNAIHVSDDDKKDTSPAKDTEDDSEEKDSGSSNLNIWGIQESDVTGTDYADVSFLMKLFSGIVPLRNVSFLGVAISFGLALCSTIGVVFLLVFIGAIGGAHPNTKKAMDYISGSRSRILGVSGLLLLALFMIVMVFFFLYVFNKLSLFAA